MSAGTNALVHDGRPTWRWWTVAGVAVTALVSGAFGFWQYEVDRTGEGHILDSLYHAVQMCALHSPTLSPPTNVPLEVGRWLAVAFLGLATAGAVRHAFREQVRAFQIGRLKRHIVICGPGPIAGAVVRDRRAKEPRRRILVITAQEDVELRRQCEALTAQVIVGAPSAVLPRARLETAESLIAIFENDTANIEIAVHASSMTMREPRLRPLRCHVQVRDVDLRQSLRQLHPARKGLSEIRFFDFFSDSARDVLLNRLPLDHGGVTEHDPRQVHLIIVGFGAMGRTVAVKAAQLGHFANRRPLRISVVDQTAVRQEQDLLLHYPAIRRTCELSFHACAAQSAAALDLLNQWCADRGTIKSLVVCLADDAAALDVAIKVGPIDRKSTRLNSSHQ